MTETVGSGLQIICNTLADVCVGSWLDDVNGDNIAPGHQDTNIGQHPVTRDQYQSQTIDQFELIIEL